MAAPQEQFEKLKLSIINSLRGFFPITGKRHEIRLNNIWADDNLESDNYPEQVKAYDKKRDFAIPIYGDLTLKDIATGKNIDRAKKIKLISLPKITTRGTYIVDGNEYQIPSQLLLKPNVYNRIKEDGQLETFINIRPVALHLYFDPKKGVFSLRFGTQKKVNLYPFLRGLGISDSEMSSAWGQKVLEFNQKARGEPLEEVKKFYRMAYREDPISSQEAVSGVLKYLNEKELDPKTTSFTLGKSVSKMSANVLVDSASKLLSLNKGEQDPDEKDALHFKRVSEIDSFIPQRLEKEKRMLLFRVKQKIDSKDNIRDIIRIDTFNKPVHSFFTNTSLSGQAKQLNPLASFSESNKLTIMGEGGLMDSNVITDDARAVHPSQLGFIDPIHTPESDKIGAISQKSLLTKVTGGDLTTAVIDLKTGKTVRITPVEASKSVISFADQYKLVGNKYKPKYTKVKASINNKMGEISPGKVDYILVSDKQIFSISSNMTPFINHISGNRSMMSGKHMEQALPLKYREAPLVQNKMTSGKTFEKHIGEASNSISKIDGEVIDISKDHIKISDGKKTIKHHLYNKFINPGDKVFFHQTPLVSVGDKIKKGQIIAESNYSDKGVYSTGANLRIALSPYKGYTFEDGFAISEEAAKKLTSMHMYKEKVSIDANSILNKAQYLSYFPSKISSDNFSKLDDRGIIKKGSKLNKGDVIVAHLHKEDYTKEDVLIAQFNKKFLKPYKDRSVTWDREYGGTVRKIIERPREIEVQIETEEAAQLGDKLAGRAGNKGIITHIIPQNEVPTTVDGKPIDIFMNPHAIVGRINPAQIIEAAAGKLAEKRGKPYIVDNFREENYHKKIEKELREAGLKDKEYIKTPDGVIDKPISVGKMHILKLNHPVSKKFQVRETGSYTVDSQPTSGGGKGASKMDQLTIYGMLSHGASKNLQEAMTIKGEKNDDFWHAYQAGLPVPKPKVPFTFEKFENMLKASGINMQRHGDELQLMPLTDKDIKDVSNGEIKDPEFIQGKNLREIKSGLFDPNITGGKEGTNWGHINLAEPIPNPVFEGAIKSILGLKESEYKDIIEGTSYVDKGGVINSQKRGVTSGEAIKILLSKINIEKQLELNIEQAKKLKGSQLDAVHRKIRYLKALKETKLDPTVYVSDKVAVIPPKFRPITPSDGGRLNIAAPNPLYRDLMLINNQLKKQKDNKFPDEQLKVLRKNLYNSYGALVGTEKSLTDRANKDQPGFLQMIHGKKPKEGFFQDKMLSKRQDFSARSTIIPEPYYNIDDVGLPEDMVWSLYKPFVVRRLQQIGYKPNQAIDEVEKRSKIAKGMLEQEVESRPVMLNRAPSLHKFSIMAFNPKITTGKAIKVNPLIVGGFNADFDGDCVQGNVFIILTKDFKANLDKDFDFSFGDNYINKEDVRIFIKERMVEMPSISKLPIIENDDVIIINLEDFPRIKSSKRISNKGTIIYDVPNGVNIITCDQYGENILSVPVTEFSVHPDLENRIVTLSNKEELFVSYDQSMVSLNSDTWSIEKCTPEEAVGRAIPKIENIDTGCNINEVELIDYSTGINSVKCIDSVRLDKKFGWFIGAMVGDGWIASRNGRTDLINISSTSDSIINNFSDQVDSLMLEPIKLTITKNPHRFKGFDCNSRRATKTSISLGLNITRFIGSGAENKHLPGFFISGPKEFRLGLLSGLLDTDGSICYSNSGNRKRPQICFSYTTISLRLVTEVVALCRSLGISTGVTEYRNAYCITMSSRHMHKKGLCLKHEKKSKIFKKFCENELIDSPASVKNDMVPFSEDIAAIATKNGLSYVDYKSEYTSIRQSVKRGLCSRSIAKKIISIVDNSFLPKKWIDIVNNKDITWLYIKEIKKNKRRITMYDITAPGPYTFMLDNGVVVQDSMGVHIPVSDDAVQEARRMLPSNNLFNPGDNSLVHKPSMEQLTGLYLMTKPGRITNKKYSDPVDVIKSYKNGKIKINDVIKLKSKSVVVGSILVNSILPVKYRDYNKVLDKTAVNNLLNKIAKEDSSLYGKIASKLKNLGNDAAYRIGLTTGIDDLKIDYNAKNKLIDAAKKELDKKGLPGLAPFADRVKAVAQKSLDLNNSGFHDMLRGGSASKVDAVTQMVATPFLTTDNNSKPIPFVIENSYAQGMTAPEYFSTLSGARRGMMDRALSTTEPGAFTKEMINSVIGSKITEHDCHTKQGVDVSVKDKEALIGRYTTDHKLIDNKFINNYKGQTIKVRSPLTCEAKSPPCAICFGTDETGNPPQIGTYIGTIAGQALTEPSTQMLMRCGSKYELVTIKYNNKIECITMEECYNKYHDKKVKILDKNGFVDVTAIQRHKPTDKMVFIKSSSGHAEVFQANHPLWLEKHYNECECHNPNIKFIHAQGNLIVTRCNTCKRHKIINKKDMFSGQYVVEAKKSKGHYITTDSSFFIKSNGNIVPEIPGYIAGFYMAEGCVRRQKEKKNRPVAVLFSQKNNDYKKKLSEELDKWNHGYSWHDNNISIYNLKLAKLFSDLMPGFAWNKKLNGDFIYYNRDWCLDFVCAMIDGNGSVCLKHNKQNYIKIHSSSYTLLKQIQIILASCKVPSSIGNGGMSQNKKKSNKHNFYFLEIRLKKRHKGLFKNSIKMKNYVNFANYKDYDSSITIDKISSVTDVVYEDDYVYDIKTETESFLAGCLRTHNSFHTGGSVLANLNKQTGADGFHSGFKRVEQILELPTKIKGKAILAETAGIITSIDPAPQGGWNATINDDLHYIPGNLSLIVKRGDRVGRGDKLSTGIVKPQELAELTNPINAKRHMVSEIDKEYRAEGRKIRPALIETVVNSFVNKGKVKDPGTSDLIVGDYINMNKANALNKEGKNIKVTPVFQGINQAPFMNEDFLSRLNFQRLKESLREGASQNWKSSLVGTNPIPGLVYGADFGAGELS